MMTQEELRDLQDAHAVAAAELAELERWAAVPLEEVRPADLRVALDARRRWETDGGALRRMVRSYENRLSDAQRAAAMAARRAHNDAWLAAALVHRGALVDLLEDADALAQQMIGGEKVSTGSHRLVSELTRFRRELRIWRAVMAGL